MKDKIDVAKDKIALQASLVEHQKQHITPDTQSCCSIHNLVQFPTFDICEECSAIYTHQNENVDSETGKVAPENNSIHMITDGVVPYQEPIEVSRTFDSEKINTCENPIFVKDGKYKRRFVENQNGIVHTPRQVVEVSTKSMMIPKNKDSVNTVKFDDVGRYIRTSDMELAIVGSSKIMEWQVQSMDEKIRTAITSAKEVFGDRLVVSSGGASGVDTMAEEIAIELGVRTHIYAPDVQGWDDGQWNRELQRVEIGYKTRNINIAKQCCKILNLVGKAPKKPKFARQCKDCKKTTYFKELGKDNKCKDSKCGSSNMSKGRTSKVMCKHCNLPHYTSGGCFTANKAFWLGKNAETIAV